MKYLRFDPDCWFTLLVLLFVLEILKEKSSKIDESTGHFQSFFFSFHIRPQTADPKSEKNPVNELIETIWQK